MSRVVFLLEEQSMKVLLDGLLPRLVPTLPFVCIPHEGKQDLERSIPRKLRGWREPGTRFVVVRDNDGGDCVALKGRLKALCSSGGRDDAVVRLACQELEAWYLGDSEALANAYSAPALRSLHRRERFRDPDSVIQPARALKTLVPEFQKISGARRMAQALSRTSNRSRSFRLLVQSVEALAAQLTVDEISRETD